MFIYRSVCGFFTLSPCSFPAEVCLSIEMLDKVSIDPHDDDVDACAQIDTGHRHRRLYRELGCT